MNNDENKRIKEELYSLYITLIKNNNSSNHFLSEILDISSYTNLSLINYIKKYITNLISNNKKYKETLSQLESTIKKLEIDIKYYLKNLFHYKIKNNSLEVKLNAFITMEEDYEELKEKVKYEEGKFLENDRKDNEIMILRNENSKIKKDVMKLESQKTIYEKEKKDYKELIKKLQNDNENLNKKIIELEKINKEKINSSLNLKLNTKENKEHIINKKLKRNNFSLSNLQNIINFTNNNYINNSNKKLINILSPKDDLLYLERSRNKYNHKTTVNTNLFTATYNKILKGMNTNANKSLFPFKKDFCGIKYTRNKSLSVMKGRDSSETKTTSFNSNFMHKSDNKQKTINKIINTKKLNAFYLNNNINDLKNIGNNEKKYINQNGNGRISSAKNIKNNKF
mgnify:CR=1 FL=1